MRLHGIGVRGLQGSGFWSGQPESLFSQLIRVARRMAEGLQAEWLAVYVETPRRFPARRRKRIRLNKNLRLARELGAETISLTGSDVAGNCWNWPGNGNVSQIIIGKRCTPGSGNGMHGSVVDKVIRQKPGDSVHVIPANQKRAGSNRAAGPVRQPF